MENPYLAQIKSLLEVAIVPSKLEIIDNSHLHKGHASNTYGGGHYHVILQATAFDGLSAIQRHRLVYKSLQSLLDSKEIHALQIDAKDSNGC
jgi:BolA protein